MPPPSTRRIYTHLVAVSALLLEFLWLFLVCNKETNRGETLKKRPRPPGKFSGEYEPDRCRIAQKFYLLRGISAPRWKFYQCSSNEHCTLLGVGLSGSKTTADYWNERKRRKTEITFWIDMFREKILGLRFLRGTFTHSAFIFGASVFNQSNTLYTTDGPGCFPWRTWQRSIK